MQHSYIITGFENTAGISGRSFQQYDINKLYYLKPLRKWKKENGESKCSGFSATPEKALSLVEPEEGDKAGQQRYSDLKAKLLEQVYPIRAQIVLEPDRDDPSIVRVLDVTNIANLVTEMPLTSTRKKEVSNG